MLTEVADSHSRVGETPRPDKSQQTCIRGRQATQPVPRLHDCGFLHHETRVICGSQLDPRDMLWTNPSIKSGKLVKDSCIWGTCTWSVSYPFLQGRTSQIFGSGPLDAEFADTGWILAPVYHLFTHIFRSLMLCLVTNTKKYHHKRANAMSGRARTRHVLPGIPRWMHMYLRDIGLVVSVCKAVMLGFAAEHACWANCEYFLTESRPVKVENKPTRYIPVA